jgi:hypothetical protein
MRGMSLLQMAGGIAVAGAVAAGTTAFTAGSGLTNSAGANKFIGGRTQISVSGATMTAANFVVDSANSNEDHVLGVAVTLKDDLNADITTGVTVKAAFTATNVVGAGTPASGAFITCTHGGSGVWNCVGTLDTTHYYTAVTALTVTVVQA